MAKVSVAFRFKPETKKVLAKRAKESKRSMTAHLEHLIEQDAKYAKLPSRKLEAGYWETAEGVEQSR
jgi:predicted transcriptional regulator